MFIRRTPKCSTRLYSKTYQVTLSLFLQSSYPPLNLKYLFANANSSRPQTVVRWFNSFGTFPHTRILRVLFPESEPSRTQGTPSVSPASHSWRQCNSTSTSPLTLYTDDEL